MAVFVIEHLEPELYEWCMLEYKHVSSVVGRERVLFTNVESKELEKYGSVDKRSVVELNLKNACVLDPEAAETLTPEKAKQFQNFIFGGILGDSPPKARTGPELTAKLNLPAFNLGKDQMSTDTAVIVAKEIVEGKPLSLLEFKDGVEIEINENESVELPYKYLVKDGKPLLPEGLVDMLRKQEGF